MKTAVVFLSAMLIIFVSCSKKEDTKLTAFSTEAFAYGMDDSSEVDATTRIKGFQQKEKNDTTFTATISYDIDLVTPKGDTVKSLLTRVVDRMQREKMSDTQLDAQFDLDSTFAKGKYKLIFRIKDVLSGQTATTSANFNLGD